MRRKVIIAFFLTLAGGIAVAERQSVGDWFWPLFAKCEVEALVEKRVVIATLKNSRDGHVMMTVPAGKLETEELELLDTIERVPGWGLFFL